ncbi:MAG: AMP-binding protein, partial [Planctomycetota bacterium]
MIHDVPLGEVLERAADLWPEKTALTYGDDEWSFRELFAESCRAASRMRLLGVQPGEHVALWAANSPEWVFLQFGLARLGAVLVTANTALAREDLTYLLQHSDSVALLSGREAKGNDMLAILNTLDRSTLPRLREVVLLEGGELRGAMTWESLGAGEEYCDATPVGLDDLINMQYTSGTTGFP